jgi:hypothetical protein
MSKCLVEPKKKKKKKTETIVELGNIIMMTNVLCEKITIQYKCGIKYWLFSASVLCWKSYADPSSRRNRTGQQRSSGQVKNNAYVSMKAANNNVKILNVNSCQRNLRDIN